MSDVEKGIAIALEVYGVAEEDSMQHTTLYYATLQQDPRVVCVGIQA